MRRALRLFAILSLVPFVALRAGAETSPIEFERVNKHIPMSVVSSEEIEQQFQSLSMSGDAGFVSLGRPYARVDIWTGDGGETAKLRLSYREDRRALVAMLGDPCVAVIAVGARMDASAPSPGAAARPIELWTCQSGERIAQIPHENADARNDLVDLVALPACGLAVASYSDRVTVVDIARRARVPALSGLFHEMRSGAIRSYPTEEAVRASKVRLKMAARASGDDCLLYAVPFEYSARAKALLPAKLYEVDLRRAHSRLVRALEYEPVVEGGRAVPTTSFAISPSGRYAALSIGRPIGLDPQVDPPRGVADMLIIDLKSGEIVKNIDIRHLVAGVIDLAFVSDDALLLSMQWIGQSTEAHLLDWRSERTLPICSASFGEADGTKGNPRALAVNAKLNLVAVSMRDEVRVFHYKLKPAARWTQRNCGATISR